MTYEPRVYRTTTVSSDLVGFSVSTAETGLYIHAESPLAEQALAAAGAARAQVERHTGLHADFGSSLRPLPEPADCPQLVARMYRAARQAGTGPMAAVAGAVAEYVGRRLLADSPQVIVENGGDIFLATRAPRIVAIRAGKSPLSGRVGLVIPGSAKLGVCTSSGTVGHSRSGGQADAATVVAEDTALADAIATAMANRVGSPQDCQAAVNWAAELGDIIGAVAICGETMAAWGEIDLEPLAQDIPEAGCATR